MKTALVLSGGGAKGSIQFGILKKLVQSGLSPDAVYGTSVGALNAAGFAHLGIEGLQEVWNQIHHRSDVFSIDLKALILKSSGIFSSEPLRKLIDAATSKPPTIPAYACKVSMRTGQIAYAQSGSVDYNESVEASACIPGLTNLINGEWADGGLREQTPLKKAIKDGHERIVVILCNTVGENVVPQKPGNWISNILRSTDIMAHEIFLNDISNCLWYNKNLIDGKRQVELEVYAPPRPIIDSLDFNQEKIQPAIKFGFEQGYLVDLKKFE